MRLTKVPMSTYTQQTYSPLKYRPYQNEQYSLQNYQYLPKYQDGIITQRKNDRKTESYNNIPKGISQLSIKSINQEIYRISKLEPNEIEYYLRNSSKNVSALINNQLLFSLKSTASTRLFLYNLMLMYIDQVSKNHKNSRQNSVKNQRQRANSIKSQSNNRSTDLDSSQVTRKTVNQFIPNIELQSIKQTIPFIPRSRQPSNQSQNSTSWDFNSEQLTHKIQTIKKNLQHVVRKVDDQQSSYRLSGEDIVRLKKSWMIAMQLKPTGVLHNVNALQPTPHLHTNQPNISRPQSRSKTNDFNGSFSRAYNKTMTSVGFGMSRKSSVERFRQQDSLDDQQSNQILIEQLQQIIEKKQNRIKQLTKQLSKNIQQQHQLQSAMQTFQNDLQAFQTEKHSLLSVVQKLQQENVGLQLQLRQLQTAEAVRKQASQLTETQLQEQNTYEYLKTFELRQKMLKFAVDHQISICIEPHSQQAEQKILSSYSGQNFNDISQITPKRQSKKLLSNDFEQYLQENNSQTVRKGMGKVQIRHKPKIALDFSNNVQDRQGRGQLQKFVLLQALTIEQLIEEYL